MNLCFHNCECINLKMIIYISFCIIFCIMCCACCREVTYAVFPLHGAARLTSGTRSFSMFCFPLRIVLPQFRLDYRLITEAKLRATAVTSSSPLPSLNLFISNQTEERLHSDRCMSGVWRSFAGCCFLKNSNK